MLSTPVVQSHPADYELPPTLPYYTRNDPASVTFGDRFGLARSTHLARRVFALNLSIHVRRFSRTNQRELL